MQNQLLFDTKRLTSVCDFLVLPQKVITSHTCTVCSLFIQLKAIIANATKQSRHVFTTAMLTQGKHLTLVNICRERNKGKFSELLLNRYRSRVDK